MDYQFPVEAGGAYFFQAGQRGGLTDTDCPEFRLSISSVAP
jgi:hypothetical protein